MVMSCHMGVDQYLLIPFLGGGTSIHPSYFDVNYTGTRFWHTAIWHLWYLHQTDIHSKLDINISYIYPYKYQKYPGYTCGLLLNIHELLDDQTIMGESCPTAGTLHLVNITTHHLVNWDNPSKKCEHSND